MLAIIFTFNCCNFNVKISVFWCVYITLKLANRAIVFEVRSCNISHVSIWFDHVITNVSVPKSNSLSLSADDYFFGIGFARVSFCLLLILPCI